MFKRTIVGVSNASAILSAIVILMLAVTVVFSSLSERNTAQQDRQLIDLIGALDDVAHNFAVERGLTAGFLGSKTDEAKVKVDKQRQLASQKLQALSRLLSQPQAQDIRMFAAPLLDHVDSLNSIRRQVDNVDGSGVFLYYSQLNRLSLDTMASLLKLLSHAELKSQVNTLLQLAWYKERAGQVRGRVNGVLAKQTFNDAARSDVEFYQRELDTLTNYLTQQTQGEEAAQIKGLLSSDGVREMNDVLQRLLNGSGDFSVLPGPAEWFPMATRHIGDVKKRVDQNWGVLKQRLDDIERSALVALWVTVGLIGIGLVGLLIINGWLRVLLSRELPGLINTLELMASNRDLSTPVRLQGEHEMARISSAVQHLVDSMRDSLGQMKRVLEVSEQVNDKLDQASLQLLENSEKAQRMATNIATAIEENSSTSSEIAKSASHTMDNTRQISEQTQVSLEASQSAGQQLAKLKDNAGHITQQSEQLTACVESITQTVSRINELFEQTNLLALNASIEAARAGEHGRGFAVVADEVRSLAFRSIEASDQIAEVLKGLNAITQQVSNSVLENNELSDHAMSATQQNGSIMVTITETLNQLSSMSTSVAAATEEQYAVSQTIAEDAAHVMKTASTSHEAALAIQDLAKQLDGAQQELRSAYQQFTL
ncbi:MAG: hypothetical protein RL336_1131 [Pseudomonadota bacterium]